MTYFNSIRSTSTSVRRIACLLVSLLVLAGCSGIAGTQPPAPSQSADTGSSMNMGSDSTSSDMPGMAMTPLDSTTWEGMKISLASSPPARFSLFQGSESRIVEPKPEDSMHLMAVLADDETGERIPYATVWVTITNQDGTVVFDERMWPMISRSMGTHYGINVPLPEPGTYDVQLRIGPPQAARHPEYMDRWQEPYSFATTLDWEGQQ